MLLVKGGLKIPENLAKSCLACASLLSLGLTRSLGLCVVRGELDDRPLVVWGPGSWPNLGNSNWKLTSLRLLMAALPKVGRFAVGFEPRVLVISDSLFL